MNCDRICLVEACSANFEYYVNYSRYHGICNIHASLFSQNTLVNCKHCNAKVKIFADLEYRSKLEYDGYIKLAKGFIIIDENIEKPIEEINPQVIEENNGFHMIESQRKCTQCNSKHDLKTFCGEHYYCIVHAVKNKCRKTCFNHSF